MDVDEILDAVDWDEHADDMVEAITPNHIKLMELSWGEAQKDFPDLPDFDLKNPHVKKAVKTLGKRITGIAETTRNDIKGILETALTSEDKIPGIDAIAKLIRESGATNSVSRSRTIARTETTAALNQGTLSSYAELGIEKVEILDSDDDPECSERNGTTVTLEEAMAIEPHPNCVMAFSAVVD